MICVFFIICGVSNAYNLHVVESEEEDQTYCGSKLIESMRIICSHPKSFPTSHKVNPHTTIIDECCKKTCPVAVLAAYCPFKLD